MRKPLSPDVNHTSFCVLDSKFTGSLILRWVPKPSQTHREVWYALSNYIPLLSHPWIHFLQVLMRDFQMILSIHTSSNKLAPKSDSIVQIWVTCKWKLGSKGLRHFVCLCPSPQSGIWRKNVVCAKELVHFHSFFPNKTGKFLFMF